MRQRHESHCVDAADGLAGEDSHREGTRPPPSPSGSPTSRAATRRRRRSSRPRAARVEAPPPPTRVCLRRRDGQPRGGGDGQSTPLWSAVAATA